MHSEYVILIAFPGNNGYAKASLCKIACLVDPVRCYVVPVCAMKSYFGGK